MTLLVLLCSRACAPAGSLRNRIAYRRHYALQAENVKGCCGIEPFAPEALRRPGRRAVAQGSGAISLIHSAITQ